MLEAFNTRYKTTGITYKGENETKATTKLGSLVDINFLPIIGLGGEINWGVQPYDAGTNGGIVGTVTYDTTRNELDPADAVTESYQPGIPGVPVSLWVPKPCTATTAEDIANSCRQGHEIVPLKVADTTDPGTMVDNPAADRGALVKGAQVQESYTSEKWQPPRGCTARQYNGQPLTDQQALPEFGAAANRMCVEAPMMGVAIGPSDTTDPSSAGQTVNGNYGFATSKPSTSGRRPTPCTTPTALDLYAPLPDGQEQDLRAQDYIVSVDIPNDPVDGKPMYQVTKEEDVNVFDGDGYLPQENYPPATPAIANDPAGPPNKTPLPPQQPPSQQAGIISACAGAAAHGATSPTERSSPAAAAPSRATTARCAATSWSPCARARRRRPTSTCSPPVPIPTHFWGLTLNDLGPDAATSAASTTARRRACPTCRWASTTGPAGSSTPTHTDFNGLYEALEPSTSTVQLPACRPVRARTCTASSGNDPGQPGH